MDSSPAPKSGIALYYPYIHIQDSDWLKAALLYWDGIRRIVPQSINPDDAEEIIPFAREGLLKNTRPSPYVRDADIRFRQGLLPLFNNRNLRKKLLLPVGRQRPVEEGRGFIHNDKMLGGLRHSLGRWGLGRDRGDWIELDNRLASLYMTCLATVMSEAMGAPPVTDSLADDPIGEYLTLGYPSRPSIPVATASPRRLQTQRPEERHDLLLRLGIPLPRPSRLHHVSAKSLIHFHNKYAAERRRFRQAIEGIANQAMTIHDANALNDYLSAQKQEIKEAIKDHRAALKEINIRSAVAFTRGSAPSLVLSTIIGYVASILQVTTILGGFGIALGASAWWAEGRSARREQIKKMPWHYLLTLKSEFPTELAEPE